MSPIAGQTTGPIGQNFFCGHLGVAGECFRLQNSGFFKKKDLFFKFFFPGQHRALQLGVDKAEISACLYDRS